MSGSSGTYAFNPPVSELVIEAFERCGKRATEISAADAVASALRSLNLVLSSWANRGVNLWKVDQVAALMPAGVGAYAADPSTIDVLPDSVFLRQYLMSAPTSIAPEFSTTAGSASVTVAGLPATPEAGGYIAVVVPVSIGGLVLQGFYQVQSVPSSGSVAIVAASAASSVASGGAVPTFATTAGSSSVTVTLAGHGLLAAQSFMVQQPTQVGGLTLSGSYTVTSVVSASQFTIATPSPAGSTASDAENGGQALIATQVLTAGVTPTDIMLFPLSRGDYAAIPDKGQQGRPTSFWFDRTIAPSFNIWPVPDADGPYELRYYRHRQIQDADFAGGYQMDLPYRAYEAFAADFAAHLAMKLAPERAVALAAYAQMKWQEFSDQDRERVSSYMTPDLSGYFD